MSMQARGVAVPRESTTLADLLDRVLDKGLVVAGDISVSLANVELLTIRIRLIVCSIDKAQQIGLNWWKYDKHFGGDDAARSLDQDTLRRQIEDLQRKVASLTAGRRPTAARRSPTRGRSRNGSRGRGE